MNHSQNIAIAAIKVLKELAIVSDPDQVQFLKFLEQVAAGSSATVASVPPASTATLNNGPVVTAALAVSNIVKSSLGPLGLDKMLVDDIDGDDAADLILLIHDRILLYLQGGVH